MESRPRYSFLKTILFLALLLQNGLYAAEFLTGYASRRSEGRSIYFFTTAGQQIRITPYGENIVRVQYARYQENFFPDDRYEMVQSHNWGGRLEFSDLGTHFTVESGGIILEIHKYPLRISFYRRGDEVSLLKEGGGVSWDGTSIQESFVYNTEEHFTGLGHGFFGRSEHLDLQGQILERNYGSSQGNQAPLIVPFFLSSKGYGVFLNSTFPNSFNFGKDGRYEFAIDGEGRMDYFFIVGPEFSQILDRYTQLTGRPRLPPLAIFGLGLSDKANDENSTAPSDEEWWKQKVTDHRAAGYPIDHLINDNRWRAGGGKRCESYFEWDSTRFPDPQEYERWIKANGLVVTIDFNRCIAKASEGWKASYNIPVSDSIDFGDSAPDFTREDVRDWFWRLLWRKSLSPKLEYPGDALWIDEFDELGKAPATMVLGNGMTWNEMKNYWFFLIAKTIVADGWDKQIAPAKRPFVWVRGMTAGAQRYATLWSGDIKPTYGEMRGQVRSMQLAGLSGFPFWGHDAGGFYDWEKKSGPDDSMYCKWSMAFGSFSPFWKPHGMGQSRWPLDRGVEAQREAKIYSDLRYELMPYTYTYAKEASSTGMPVARAMILEHQHEALAWKYDLEYMWGDELLVAPDCYEENSVPLWLPEGTWYDFWTDSVWSGNRQCVFSSPEGRMPLFVKSGSIIPMAFPALGTALIRKDSMVVRVYVGANGSYTLSEDDGISELYRTKGETRTTSFAFINSILALDIAPAHGTFEGAPLARAYRVEFHGLEHPICMMLNGKELRSYNSNGEAAAAGEGVVWDKEKKMLSVFTAKEPVNADLLIEEIEDCSN
ncbi:MAG TPA: TIM-barrel domain-containing protein [Bacteroidota bacterium]|nr:TIM-barrel domain-containing protein [Bacteroidota bacterium]